MSSALDTPLSVGTASVSLPLCDRRKRDGRSSGLRRWTGGCARSAASPSALCSPPVPSVGCPLPASWRRPSRSSAGTRRGAAWTTRRRALRSFLRPSASDHPSLEHRSLAPLHAGPDVTRCAAGEPASARPGARGRARLRPDGARGRRRGGPGAPARERDAAVGL